jgi:hypothetical protein
MLPPECMKLAIDSTQLLLLWLLHDLEQSRAPTTSAVTALAKAVYSFGAQLDEIGAAEEDMEVQQAIQKTQSNLFLVFSERKLKVRISWALLCSQTSQISCCCPEPARLMPCAYITSCHAETLLLWYPGVCPGSSGLHTR